MWYWLNTTLISLSLASHLHNLINQSINSLIELTYFNLFIIYYKLKLNEFILNVILIEHNIDIDGYRSH